MQNWLIYLLTSIVTACIAGCGQTNEAPMTEIHHEQPVNLNSQASARSGSHPHAKQEHHSQHQAFADAVERAKIWNDSDRDTWQHPDQIVAALALKPGAVVADIGTGTGYMVALLSQAVGADGTVIAIDAEAAMIEYLTERSADLGPAKIVLQKVGFDDPQLNPGSVDGVLTLDTWHHIKLREAYAKEVYVGLKQGGRFVVVDHEVNATTGPPKSMRLEPEQVAKELASAGFRAEVVPESMPRHYMIVGHKD